LTRQSKANDIDAETARLRKGRLICALLRQEGILAPNAHLVLRLANDLLKSFSYHTHIR
jgi:hypothetical protein